MCAPMQQADFEKLLDTYTYSFDRASIATSPANPRDSARLLRYLRAQDTVSHTTFRDLMSQLPKNALVVLNDTKVIPARIVCTRSTGGTVELLYLRQEGLYAFFLANKKLHHDEELRVGDEVKFVVSGTEGKEWVLKPTFPVSNMLQFLEQHGVTPIPPYIKHVTLSEARLREEYQTVFADTAGSVAAPTASLHFTNELLAQGEKSGIEIVRVTLHVGLGTFAPLTQEAVESGALHEEWYSISEDVAQKITAAQQNRRPIIAVGTTVVRTLESAADDMGTVISGSRTTNIFIQPGYTFKVVNGMITNFHVPKSSLLMLVAAFVGREKILQIYADAIARGYRLFSFGDAMLLL